MILHAFVAWDNQIIKCYTRNHYIKTGNNSTVSCNDTKDACDIFIIKNKFRGQLRLSAFNVATVQCIYIYAYNFYVIACCS